MPKILDRLELAANTNPAEALKLLPELFKAVHEGKIVELPCAIGDMVLLDTEIMGCSVGKMPFKIADILFSAYGDFGSATQTRTITRAEVIKRLESENHA